MKRHILSCLLLVAAAPAAGATLDCPKALTPYTAQFAATYGRVEMTGTRTLTRPADGGYLLAQESKVFGASVSEKSRFAIDRGHFAIDRYDMVRSIVGSKREFHVRADWENGQAVLTGRHKGTLPLDGHPLDLLNHQLALRCDLERGTESFSYPVIAKNLIRDYRFEVTGEARLKTEMGELDTLVVERIRDNDERRTLAWIAPSLNYVIVRLEQYEQEDDTSYVLEIRKVDFQQ